MIGAPVGGSGINNLSQLMQLVEFVLAASKEPERIRAVIEEVAQAKAEALEQLMKRQQELEALRADVERIRAQNAAEAERLVEFEAKLQKWQDDIETAGREHAEHVMAENTRLHNLSLDLHRRIEEVEQQEAYWRDQTEALAARERVQAQEHKEAMSKAALLQAAAEAQKEALDAATAEAEARKAEYESKLAKLKALAE